MAPQTPEGGKERRPPPQRLPSSVRKQIDRIDARERRFGFVAAVLAVVVGVVVYVVETRPHYHLAKGQLSPATSLVLGFVAGALLAGATVLGRRALLAFAALFAFLAFGGAGLFLALPFAVFGGWLLLRSYRLQKDAAASAGTQEGAKGSASSPGRAVPVTSGRDAGREGRGRQKSKGQAGPTPNKRYTPKKPAPSAPPPAKPSWTERRAARAAERER